MGGSKQRRAWGRRGRDEGQRQTHKFGQKTDLPKILYSSSDLKRASRRASIMMYTFWLDLSASTMHTHNIHTVRHKSNIHTHLGMQS